MIEKYFAAPDTKGRQSVLAELQKTGLDAATLGGMLHTRSGWGDLAPGVYYINEKSGAYTAKYFLGVPGGYRKEKPWPLVVMLPTADAFVTDPPPDGDRIAKIYSDWLNVELARHPDALVIMPLLDVNELFGPSYRGVNSVMQPIFNVAGKANVDPARVYMIGFSMAAHAVWNIALHYPTYFAAINPLAGGADAPWQRIRLPNLRNVLSVVWADTADAVEPIQQTSGLVEAMHKLNLEVVYEQTTGKGHQPPADLIEKDYQLMRARVRDLYPRHITLQSTRPDAIFNRVDWVQVYQPLESGADRIYYLQHGTGQILTNQYPYALEATLDKNTVTIATVNVDSIRLYFNPQMVDFHKPVVVIANGKERFRGMLQPSIDEMMRDQLFLGRGWRYYSAVLDVELSAAPVSPPPSPSATRPAAAPGTTRPHGRITIYNDDGTVQRVIESP